MSGFPPAGDGSGAVSSVNGQTGAVVLTAADVGAEPAGGGGGGAVSSVNGQTGAVVLAAADVGAQPSDADLAALAALSATGLAARTAANTWAQRSLAVGSAKLTVTNPAGVAGNPTLDLGSVASSDLSDGSTLATKAYADAIKAAIPSEAECEWATAAALPAYVYANGASGVGATLTGVSVGALSVDGNPPAVGDDVLVKNEAGANRAYHGPYRVTTVGSGVAVYVLTRRTDWDQAAEIAGGDTFFVQGGSANQGTTWTLNLAEGTAVTVGTTVLPFIQTSGPGTIVAGTGIGVSGSTVSLSNPVAVNLGGTGAATLAVHGVVIGNGASAVTVSGAGTSGQVLTSNGASADPSFEAAGGGYTDPLTTRGDLVARGASATQRLALGANGQFLGSDGTDTKWVNVSPWYVCVNCLLAGTAAVTGTWVTAIDTRFLMASYFYNSTASQNDEVNYDLTIGPGTWTFEFSGSKDNNRAIATVSLDDGAGNFTTVGTFDQYAVSSTFNTIGTLSGFTVTGGATVRRLKVKAATKNGSSSGYVLAFAGIAAHRTA